MNIGDEAYSAETHFLKESVNNKPRSFRVTGLNMARHLLKHDEENKTFFFIQILANIEQNLLELSGRESEKWWKRS